MLLFPPFCLPCATPTLTVSIVSHEGGDWSTVIGIDGALPSQLCMPSPVTAHSRAESEEVSPRWILNASHDSSGI